MRTWPNGLGIGMLIRKRQLRRKVCQPLLRRQMRVRVPQSSQILHEGPEAPNLIQREFRAPFLIMSTRSDVDRSRKEHYEARHSGSEIRNLRSSPFTNLPIRISRGHRNPQRSFPSLLTLRPWRDICASEGCDPS